MSRYASEDPMKLVDLRMDLVSCCEDGIDQAILVGRACNLQRSELGAITDTNAITVHQRLKRIEARYQRRTQ